MKLPADKLFRRRLKQTLYKNMTERLERIRGKVFESATPLDTVKLVLSEAGIIGVQAGDIYMFENGTAVASHYGSSTDPNYGKHFVVRESVVTTHSSFADALRALKEAQLDEISAETKTAYVHAAFAQGNELHSKIKTSDNDQDKTKLRDKISKRNQGIIKAAKSLQKE